MLAGWSATPQKLKAYRQPPLTATTCEIADGSRRTGSSPAAVPSTARKAPSQHCGSTLPDVSAQSTGTAAVARCPSADASLSATSTTSRRALPATATGPAFDFCRRQLLMRVEVVDCDRCRREHGGSGTIGAECHCARRRVKRDRCDARVAGRAARDHLERVAAARDDDPPPVGGGGERDRVGPERDARDDRSRSVSAQSS